MFFRRAVCLFAAWLLFVCVEASGKTVDGYAFLSPAQQQHIHALLKNYPCMGCSGHGSFMADSSPLALDLRQQVYLMMQHQVPDAQIHRYIQVRYGRFLGHHQPVFRPSFLFGFGLALAAFALLCLFLCLCCRYVKRRASASALPDDSTLSDGDAA